MTAEPAGPKLAKPAAVVAFPSPYWSMPLDSLYAVLKTQADGLSGDEAASRLQSMGASLVNIRNQDTVLAQLFAQFRNPLVLILLFAAAVAAGLGDIENAAIIAVIVLMSCLLGFWQEYGASRALSALRGRLRLNVSALRDKGNVNIPSTDIVIGDVVSLSAGSLIPADGVLIVASNLNVTEASLTGETYPVPKFCGVVRVNAGLAERSNCVYAGTSVRSGTGRFLVTAVGLNTEYAGIASSLARQVPETEFAHGVRSFGYLMTRVMIVIVSAVLIFNLAQHRPLIESLLFSMALAVGLTPELLPAIISITLASGARKMAKAGVIVRRLEALENLGSMDVLCTDKTGTLTQGVVRLAAAVDVLGEASLSVGNLAWLNASLQTGIENPLDEAVVAEESFTLRDRTFSKIDEIPYDFNRKRLSIIVENDGVRTLICKGAVSEVLAICSHMSVGGDAVIFDDKRHSEIDERFRQWSSEGFRVLAIATSLSSDTDGTLSERALCLQGFLLFTDPPKPAIAETLSELQARGIEVKIISGDNRFVTQHLASAVGLRAGEMMIGSQIEVMSNDALFAKAPNVSVFAEIVPNQKERIIAALRRAGRTVGYMGDGINDAPALHAADVGISVDGAADVAKEAADIVLLQQDLAVLKQGVDDGRRTFANTIKYISIATSANFGNMISMAVASIVLPFLPMLAKQILLNNLLSDIPAMAIAKDSVDSSVVRKPEHWNIAAIRRFMLWFGPLSSIFDFLTFGLLIYWYHAPEVAFRTGWFIESLLTQLITMLVIRTKLAVWKSRPSRLLLMATATVGLIGLSLPYFSLSTLLEFTPLDLSLLAGLVAIALLYAAVLEAIKHIFFARLDPGQGERPSAA